MAKAPDINAMSMEELNELRDTVTARIEALTEEKIAELKAKRAELDAELAKLGGKPGRATASTNIISTRTRAKPAVKYRDNKGNEWTGRGAAPKWLQAYEAEGKNREEFAV
ncbi:H-NS histone family protein [Mesorhizobium sp. M8A.F.Ca.ET.165.01.1.1]|uniref:H-NS histone family protein n=1 Tax=Mesorhizobium sp. M8A.F.Ca.ET.165.01.1.1 TaxID=2563960 RepID=UPI0010935041|nr:H-NS histone family protein [Mesorhizobium sp. M8A.F.Ca.ET.165.01.1.1]TGT42759.1 H-NS histone family protein [Mesorhizobium sp. M8A.F.Ca.ET.165.01.1.1]